MAPGRPHPPGALVKVILRQKVSDRQLMFETFFLELALEIQDLSLFGSNRLPIGLWIDPERLQLEPFLMEFPAKWRRLLIELLLLRRDLLLLLGRQIPMASTAMTRISRLILPPRTVGEGPASGKEQRSYDGNAEKNLFPLSHGLYLLRESEFLFCLFERQRVCQRPGWCKTV
jgi:hypothetical protein